MAEINPNSTAPTVFFVTMGCAKNEVDTRDMKDLLKKAGVGIADDVEGCSAVVVNTCSFIQSATEESIEAVFDALDYPYIEENNVPVIVAGCMPARYGQELESELAEAASFVPCAKEGDIAEVVLNCIANAGGAGCENARSAAQEDVGSAENCTCFEDASAEGKRYFEYVKISDGCDRFCSYCTIPFIRGRYHSFSMERIEAEVARLVGCGAREIVLIGQDTGLWGSDFQPPSSLAVLLGNLADMFPETWFRAMYTQPEHIDDSLLEVIASHENIASYLDIPLQHCSSHILESMNRKGSPSEFLELADHARSKVPGIALRTTLMVGYPGETDEDFEELVDFVQDACFEYVGIFAFSPEEGTRAAELDCQVDDVEKEYRLSKLRDVADSVSGQVVAERCGSILQAIVEGIEEDGQVFGRSSIQAPEVDGVTFLDSGKPGCFVEAEIEDTLFYDMEARTL